MSKIYGENFNNVSCENTSNNIEKEFIKEICKYVGEALDVVYMERRNFESLLFNILRDKIDDNYNGGLLQQYEQYVLDKSSERLINELNLGDVKVNHSHATHAKFRNIIDKIKEIYINDKNENNG